MRSMSLQWFRSAAIAVTALAAMVNQALAGPEGTYSVRGTNPGSDGVYEGVVEVVRSGDTYQVIWEIGGARFAGSGLGAAPVKGETIIGPAHESDYVLAVGYISGQGDFGLAYYVENDDGTWNGIWTFGGSDKIGTEVWTPR